jgi:hypothetical protein
MKKMPAKATKTIKQALIYRPRIAEWMDATQGLFKRIAAFYFEVIQLHPDVYITLWHTSLEESV